VTKPTGRMTYRKRGGVDPNAPIEAGYRPFPVSPLPPTPIAEQFAEMYANDPEAREFVSAERRGGLFAGPIR
jgi:hypothetical protein